MKKLITVRVDENIKGYCEYTIPIIKKKAKEWGADYKALTENKYIDWGDHKFHFRILEIGNLLDEYDVVLNLDADILITEHCPNPFNVLPLDKINTIYEDVSSRMGDRRSKIKTVQDKFGDIGWKVGYINSGFIMFPKSSKNIFREINGKLWTGWGSDDVHLGYTLNEDKQNVNQLDYKWNHMTMFSESWNNKANRFDSNIIHYAGVGVFDRGVPNKLEQIKRDYKQIYG
jgi:hypothetical protein